MFGDSTAARLDGEWDAARGLAGTRDMWQSWHPDWHVDALGGRPVDELGPRIANYLSTVDAAPQTVVVALGTNPVRGWSRDDYEQALAALPATTELVLVTPFRADKEAPQVARTVARYAQWLRDIAAARPGTVVADWHAVAAASAPAAVSGMSSLLRDGYHQTYPQGRLAWLRCVEDAVESLAPSAAVATTLTATR